MTPAGSQDEVGTESERDLHSNLSKISLASAAPGDTGFEVSLDAMRREIGGDDADHDVILRGAMQW